MVYPVDAYAVFAATACFGKELKSEFEPLKKMKKYSEHSLVVVCIQFSLIAYLEPDDLVCFSWMLMPPCREQLVMAARKSSSTC